MCAAAAGAGVYSPVRTDVDSTLRLLDPSFSPTRYLDLDEKVISKASKILAEAFGLRPSLTRLVWYCGDREHAIYKNIPKDPAFLIEKKAEKFSKKRAATPQQIADSRVESILRRVVRYSKSASPTPEEEKTTNHLVINRAFNRNVPELANCAYDEKYNFLASGKATGALISAAEAGDVEAVQALLRAGVTDNEDLLHSLRPVFLTEPACDIAALNGEVEVLKAFIDHIERLTLFSEYPTDDALRLTLLVRFGKEEISTCPKPVFKKLEAFVILEIAFHCACGTEKGIHAARLLLERYSEVIRLADSVLIDSLGIACLEGLPQTVRFLLAAGADPDRPVLGINFPGYNGRIPPDKTALYIATFMGHVEIVIALLEAGADRKELLRPLSKAIEDVATAEEDTLTSVLPHCLITIKAATAAGAQVREDPLAATAFSALTTERQESVLKAIYKGGGQRRLAALKAWINAPLD